MFKAVTALKLSGDMTHTRTQPVITPRENPRRRSVGHLDTESTTDGGQARLNASRPIRFQQSSQ